MIVPHENRQNYSLSAVQERALQPSDSTLPKLNLTIPSGQAHPFAQDPLSRQQQHHDDQYPRPLPELALVALRLRHRLLAQQTDQFLGVLDGIDLAGTVFLGQVLQERPVCPQVHHLAALALGDRERSLQRAWLASL